MNDNDSDSGHSMRALPHDRLNYQGSMFLLYVDKLHVRKNDICTQKGLSPCSVLVGIVRLVAVNEGVPTHFGLGERNGLLYCRL